MSEEKNAATSGEPNVANPGSVVGDDAASTSQVLKGDQTPSTFVEDELTLEEEVAAYPPFILDAPEHEFTIHEGGVEYRHTVRSPDRGVEDLFARMSKIVTTTKRITVDDEPATLVTTKNNTGKARVRYYDGIAARVTGFDVDDDGKPDADVNVQDPIDVDEEVRAELVEAKVIKEGDAVKVLHVIPDTHKLHVADQLFGGSFTIVQTKQKQVRSLRGKRRILVLQKIGVRTLDDGTQSKPTHMIVWEFTEPSGKAVGDWETEGFNSNTVVLQDGSSREERTVNLDEYEKLFDSHFKRVIGAGFATSFDGTGANGNVLPVDPTNPKHLKKVPVSLKKTVAMFVFNHVKQSVGN